MKISMLLFDGFTALDFVGGYEVLRGIPGASIEFAAHERGLVAADTRMLGLVAYRSFDEIESTDVLYVGGGPGVSAALKDEAVLGCIRRLDQRSQWTVGVCNGVELLAAAGVLEGKTVTTNYAKREDVRKYGVAVEPLRYLRDGKVVTGAGVSASIDLGLFLAGLIGGEDLSKMIQLGVEYYPAPPFGSTGADDAPEPFRNAVRQFESLSHALLESVKPPF
jgi:putative intracellular protease/amidase